MKNSNFLKGFLSGALVLLLVFAIITTAGSAHLGKHNIDLNAIFKKMDEIQTVIDENFYFDQDSEMQGYSIYQGMMKGLNDKYASYMNADEFKDHQRISSGEYFGIGASVEQNIDTLVTSVTSVYPDGPADKAGLRTGDVFLKVNGVDLTQMPLLEIISNHTSGPEGSVLTLTILRPETNEELELSITREEIISQTVSHQMLDSQTGYLQITGFEGVTADQFKSALDALIAGGAQRIIYDLRGNLGGNLDSVLDILDYLLPDDLLLYTADKNGNVLESYDGEDGHEVNLPAVILVDQDSASASEVFASAMRDYDRAKLVGVQTFGKGIVQNIIPLEDGSAIKLTTSAYFTKSGYPIQGEGLTPDLVVEMDEPKDPNAPLYPANDAQLLAALSLLDGNEN